MMIVLNMHDFKNRNSQIIENMPDFQFLLVELVVFIVEQILIDFLCRRDLNLIFLFYNW